MTPNLREQTMQKVRGCIEDNRLTYAWLLHQLSKRGIYVAASTFSCMLSGYITTARADAILAEAVKICDRYTAAFGD